MNFSAEPGRKRLGFFLKGGAMSLTQDQVNEFTGKGFIVIKGFFNPDEIEKVSAWLDELRDRQPAQGEEAEYYETSPVGGKNSLARIEK